MLSKNVLEIILGVEIERVVIIEKEKQIDHTPDGRSIRLDIYVRDEKCTVYNIEMQVENKKDTTKLQSEKVKMVDDRVNKVKTDAEVRSKYMTLANWIEEKCDQARELAMEEGRAEGRAEGHSTGLQEGKIESKVELLHVIYRKGYEVTEAVELFDLEEDFVGKLYELFQNYPEESDGKIAERYLEMLKE